MYLTSQEIQNKDQEDSSEWVDLKTVAIMLLVQENLLWQVIFTQDSQSAGCYLISISTPFEWRGRPAETAATPERAPRLLRLIKPREGTTAE